MNDPASRLPARMSTTMRISFMHDPHLRSIRFAAALLALGAFGVATAAPDSALKAAVADPGRTANFVARDTVRHPVEELSFFGIKPDMTVVELWPGGGYWTEILGPYLAKSGTYYVALESTDDKEGNQSVSRWRSRIAAEKDRLGTIHETTLAAGHFDIAPPGSADLVLTFRNLHNWMDGGYAAEALAALLQGAEAGRDSRDRGSSRPHRQTAGSEGGQTVMCARITRSRSPRRRDSCSSPNPRSTPTRRIRRIGRTASGPCRPRLSQGDKDRAKYVAIGEADNFVLKFRKPK